MVSVERFEGSEVINEADEVVLFDISHEDLLPDELVEKTPEQIWGDLSKSGQIVAKSLSMFPTSIPRTTLEYMMSPERAKDLGEDLDITAGLDELKQAGVLKEATLLDRWNTVMSTYVHDDRTVDQAKREREFAEFRIATFYVEQFANYPEGHLGVLIPEYTLSPDFKDFLIPPQK